LIDTFTFFADSRGSPQSCDTRKQSEIAPMTIADQIQLVRLKINQSCAANGREPAQVRLLAVSKTHPASAIQAAYESGITEFGESYLQEAVEKIQQLRELPLCWHFIGPLQSNKTRAIAEHFDWVQSVDREKILRRLDEQRPSGMAPLQVCIQANLFDEPQKQGATQTELPGLLEIAEQLPHIQLRGLMVIPPPQSDPQQQATQFSRVAAVFHELRQHHPSMDTLSMGMSDDMAAAIAAGSNLVRVGTAIFGVRSKT